MTMTPTVYLIAVRLCVLSPISFAKPLKGFILAGLASLRVHFAIGRSITCICASVILSCAVTGYFSAVVSAADSKVYLPILVEAESFAETGGWVINSHFTCPMSSPYLLAHGLGVPVKDSKTEVPSPKASSYRVCVRTIEIRHQFPIISCTILFNSLHIHAKI